MTAQQIEFNGVQYSPVTFEEFATHTKYSLFGVPRYRWSDKPVVILATFSSRNLTFTRRDFSRIDKYIGAHAFLKPPAGGEAGPSIAPGPEFDDVAWNRCKTYWDAFSASNGVAEHPPRFFFLGTIMFDRKVFRSHYLALDTIQFANSHAGDPVMPEPSSLHRPKVSQQATPDAPPAATADPAASDVSSAWTN